MTYDTPDKTKKQNISEEDKLHKSGQGNVQGGQQRPGQMGGSQSGFGGSQQNRPQGQQTPGQQGGLRKETTEEEEE